MYYGVSEADEIVHTGGALPLQLDIDPAYNSDEDVESFLKRFLSDVSGKSEEDNVIEFHESEDDNNDGENDNTYEVLSVNYDAEAQKTEGGSPSAYSEIDEMVRNYLRDYND